MNIFLLYSFFFRFTLYHAYGRVGLKNLALIHLVSQDIACYVAEISWVEWGNLGLQRKIISILKTWRISRDTLQGVGST